LVHFEIDFWGMPKHEGPGRSTVGHFTYRHVHTTTAITKDELMEVEYPSQMHPDYMGIACWAIDNDRRTMWRLR